ncbi:MAG TPA: TadE/TadG family type IV pilus assembly protein [Anaerolineales bacterium]|nr:TadE/TadG family type IV pilus assembly protein [Anaerolineales bacterium]
MKNIKSERGQSLVELSISILILLVLLSGAVEFGMAFFQFVQLRDAAQEGALYGSINPADNTGIEARVRNSSNSPVNLTDTSAVSVTITLSGPACEGNAITVRVSFNHQVFMPFMSQIIGSTVPLNATVTDTILSPVCP